MAQADQVLLGVLQGLGSITIHSLSGQLEDFSKGNPAAVLPTAEALVSTYPLASLILTANYTCSTAASELEFLRTASQVVNQVTSASLSACKCGALSFYPAPPLLSLFLTHSPRAQTPRRSPPHSHKGCAVRIEAQQHS
jgi:hypothetical protein